MDETQEWLRCAESPVYFLHNYGWIYDATERTWIPFKLWREQVRTLIDMVNERMVIIVKARQLGLTWLVLGFVLWLMLFHPIATALIFSRRDDEATYLLSDERMRGMYSRLPEWMRARNVVIANDHEWVLSNGSVARAFPTSAGDSYTASVVVIDEADLVPDLGKILNAAKPTIDGGGRLILLSRTDNSNPESEFKRIYRAAKQGENGWKPIFLPWYVRPDRDQEWYEAQKADILSRTTALDDLYQQYPATDAEALAPRTMDKRIAAAWLIQCYVEKKPLTLSEAPAITGLRIYKAPTWGRKYVIGGDPAEGNPTSDDSAAVVLDGDSGEEVAILRGKFQPAVFAAHVALLSTYFNRAGALIERNNHGHAVILWLKDNSDTPRLLGRDEKEGWLSTTLGKALMYDAASDVLRNTETTLHSFDLYTQLGSIQGSTLLAPDGQNDDLADAFALAQVARMMRNVVTFEDLKDLGQVENYKSAWR